MKSSDVLVKVVMERRFWLLGPKADLAANREQSRDLVTNMLETLRIKPDELRSEQSTPSYSLDNRRRVSVRTDLFVKILHERDFFAASSGTGMSSTAVVRIQKALGEWAESEAARKVKLLETETLRYLARKPRLQGVLIVGEIREPEEAWQYLAPVPHGATLTESEKANTMERSNLPQSPTLGQLARSVTDTHNFHGLFDDINLKGRTGCGMSSATIMMIPELIQARGGHRRRTAK